MKTKHDDEGELPSAWFMLFDGERLTEKLSQTALLSTVDDAGWPPLVFLSVGEILVCKGRSVLLALWPKSRTTQNLSKTGHGVLFAAVDGVVWETHLQTRWLDTPKQEGLTQIFVGDVTRVCRHGAPYAYVEALTTFRVYDPEQVVERWAAQIACMRRAFALDGDRTTH
jgi:hypothetical protein